MKSIDLLTPWSTALLEKLTGSQLVKKFPAIYGTRRLITAFTSVATYPHPVPARFSPCQWPTSWRSILILSSHLRLGLPSGLFPWFPTNNLYKPPLYHIHATCPVHLILNFLARTILGKQYRSLSCSLYSYPHSPVTSFLLGPNILLITLFSNTFSLHSYLKVSDQV
jgi:hypothetical protein